MSNDNQKRKTEAWHAKIPMQRLVIPNGKELYFPANTDFREIIKHGFEEAGDGEGFEYIVGKINGGDVKVVFELEGTHDAIIIDGVEGFGLTLVTEV